MAIGKGNSEAGQEATDVQTEAQPQSPSPHSSLTALCLGSAPFPSAVSAATTGTSVAFSLCLRLPEGGSDQVWLVITQYEVTIMYSSKPKDAWEHDFQFI